MLPLTPCESQGLSPHVRALGVTHSPAYIHPLPFPSSGDPPKCGYTGGSTTSTAGNVALSQQQLLLHHKPGSGIFQTLPGKGEKGV